MSNTKTGKDRASHKHGYCCRGAKHPLYQRWLGMKERCNNPRMKNYGGRGIRVCDRWANSFEAFLEDMGEIPEGLTLDRINNDAHYSCGKCEQCLENGWASNVRWASIEVQNMNRRTTSYLTIDGVRKTLRQWAKEHKIDPALVSSRITLRGWDAERALKTPPCMTIEDLKKQQRKRINPDDNRMIEYRNETRCLSEWAEITGITRSAIVYRISRGWDIEKVFNAPSQRNFEITFNGETKRLHEWAEITGIKSATIAKRIKTGWNIEKALTVPTGAWCGHGQSYGR